MKKCNDFLAVINPVITKSPASTGNTGATYAEFPTFKVEIGCKMAKLINIPERIIYVHQLALGV